MNALTYASNPQAAAAPARDPFAALFARVVDLRSSSAVAGWRRSERLRWRRRAQRRIAPTSTSS